MKINRDCKTRLANSEIKLYIRSRRITYTYTKSMEYAKDTVNKWCWRNWTSTVKKIKMKHSLAL